jgi:hypothetical protein
MPYGHGLQLNQSLTKIRVIFYRRFDDTIIDFDCMAITEPGADP